MKLAHLGATLAICACASGVMAGTVGTVKGVVIRRGTARSDTIVGGDGPRPEELWGGSRSGE